MRRLLVATLVVTALLVSGCATAQVLPDGRILLLSATGNKLFDPASGTATVTGASSVARIGDASAVLPDGKVLVTGGYDSSAPLGSSETWDPSTGTFSPTGDMSTPRAFHTATTLADGRVLVVGGGELNTTGGAEPTPPLATAELYDPATGTFTATGSMPAGRMLHTATLLADGKVLIAGGASATVPDSTVALLYDPASGTFSPTGSMAAVRMMHTATRLADGRVLITGGLGASPTAVAGSQSNPALTSSELFDPASGTFTAAGDMGVPRLGHTATLLKDGRVLVAGGLDSFDVTSSTSGATPKPSASAASAELYDPAAGTFTPTGAMTTQRVFHVAAPLPDGHVLLAGGGGGMGSALSGGTPSDLLQSAESYDPASGTFTAVTLPATTP
jgi:WD40 repeat protein